METVHLKLLGLGSVLLAVRLGLTWAEGLPENLRRKVVDYADAGIVATFVSLLLITFVVQVSRVEGSSMNPTLSDGQYTLVNKLIYRLHPPQRGDIIVFRAPQDGNRDYIKRVVAVEGDKVEVRDGWTRLNDLRLQEPYAQGVMEGEVPPQRLARGQVFVLGDNRDNSTDSREFGPVSRDLILGKVSLILWPLSEAGRIKDFGAPKRLP